MKTNFLRILSSLLLMFAFGFQVHAQSISGTVTDENGVPLPGATVLVQGTQNGVSTDFDGNFLINVEDENATLVISYLGFKTQEVGLNGASSISVKLVEDAASLEAVVVVGYGTVKKRDLTGAVSSVSGKNISNIPLPRVEQQLQTQVAGMNVSISNTAPGGTMQMRIRGTNSIQGNSNPLVVIDGMIGGDLKYLNSNDIESVEVLKDASSTAIYGSRGANGVIIVTTKKGRSGKLEVDFNSYFGIQQVSKKLDVMNTEEWISLQNANPNYAHFDPTDVDTDWQDEIFHTAAIQNYQVSVSGGGKTNSYLFSTNYFNQDGVIRNSNYERLSLRLNFKQEIGEHITVGNNMSFTSSWNQRIYMNEGYGNKGNPATLAALMVPPIVSVYDEDGNFSKNELFTTTNNPMRILFERDDHVRKNYLLGNAFVDIKFLEKFTYRLNLGYIVNNRLDRQYDGKNLTSSNNLGKAYVGRKDLDDVLLENTLNYSTIINDNHSLNILVGATAQNTSAWYSGITGTGFSSDNMGYYGLTNAESFSNIYTDETKSRILSFLGRINYSYKNKYYITASGRRDGASVFAKNQKWAFFPSFSLGWRLTSESLQGIADIKVRGGYGETGSQAIRPYQSLAIYESGLQFTTGEGNIFNNGTRPLRLANNDLRWETTNSYNVGLNADFLDGRLKLIADYYVKETNDLLYDKESPKYSGYSSQTQNIGTIKNSGFEIEVLANNNFGELNWDAGFNIFSNKNEVIDLGGDDRIPLNSGGYGSVTETGLLTIGQPLGVFYGYVFDGIYQNEEEVNAIDDPSAAPGRVKFKDINNDGKIDIYDKTFIGSPHPDFVWGFRNSLTYRNVNLSFNLRGVHGNEVFWTGKFNLVGAGLHNGLTEKLNYWNGDGTSNTMQALNEVQGGTSTRYIEDGSYIRLQNISLGYNLPQKLAKSLSVNSCNVYISAQNLFTITNYSGYDPEVNSRGGNDDLSNQNTLFGYDHGSYPGTRTVTVGFNVKF